MTPLPVAPDSLDGPNFGVALAALIISFLALGVGGFSLGWQIVRHYRWAKPRLTVTGMWGRYREQNSEHTLDRRAWILDVEVTNTGDVGTEIIDVYWEFPASDDQPHPLRVAGSVPPNQLVSIVQDPKGVITEKGVRDPAVPIRLESFSHLRWTFQVPATGAGRSLLREFAQGRAAVTWVARESAKNAAYGEHPHVRTTYGPWQSMHAVDIAAFLEEK